MTFVLTTPAADAFGVDDEAGWGVEEERGVEVPGVAGLEEVSGCDSAGCAADTGIGMSENDDRFFSPASDAVGLATEECSSKEARGDIVGTTGVIKPLPDDVANPSFLGCFFGDAFRLDRLLRLECPAEAPLLRLLGGWEERKPEGGCGE